MCLLCITVFWCEDTITIELMTRLSSPLQSPRYKSASGLDFYMKGSLARPMKCTGLQLPCVESKVRKTTVLACVFNITTLYLLLGTWTALIASEQTSAMGRDGKLTFLRSQEIRCHLGE